jgi:hypothetical protein
MGTLGIFYGSKSSIESVSVHDHYVRPNEMKLHGNGDNYIMRVLTCLLSPRIVSVMKSISELINWVGQAACVK